MPYISYDPTTAAAAPVTTLGAPKVNIGDTFLVMQGSLFAELGNRADATLLLRKQWINWAYRYVCALLKMDSLKGSISRATIAGQPLYLLPANVRSVQRVGIIDTANYAAQGGRKLLPIDSDQYRMLPDESDSPVSFFKDSGLLILYPTPDEVKTMVWEVTARPQDLVNDTDSPILPPEFHEAIFLRAKHVAWRALRNLKEAAIAQNEFAEALRPLQDTDAEEDREKLSSMVPVRKERHLYQRD